MIGGKAPTESKFEHGYFFLPTILDAVTPTMRIAREEIFGPVLALIEIDSFFLVVYNALKLIIASRRSLVLKRSLF